MIHGVDKFLLGSHFQDNIMSCLDRKNSADMKVSNEAILSPSRLPFTYQFWKLWQGLVKSVLIAGSGGFSSNLPGMYHYLQIP